jgi:predicted metal-dependent hydrolase
MTDLVVRRLLIDLESPVQRHWCGGDAFRSAFFGALSMSFPIGEQFFIDSVRAGLKALPPEQQARFKDEAQGFIGQEATHRRIHALFNEQIQQHGLVNDWEPRARKRLALITSLDPRHGLAITAANEHFTALFAEWMLSHPECLDGTEPRLKTLWLWHSAEEAEPPAGPTSPAHRTTRPRRRWWVHRTPATAPPPPRWPAASPGRSSG